jgi:hypothetical protein
VRGVVHRDDLGRVHDLDPAGDLPTQPLGVAHKNNRVALTDRERGTGQNYPGRVIPTKRVKGDGAGISQASLGGRGRLEVVREDLAATIVAARRADVVALLGLTAGGAALDGRASNEEVVRATLVADAAGGALLGNGHGETP